jgi:transposase
MTIKSVAALLGVSWDLVKDIHKQKLKTLYTYIDLRQVKYIAVDEFSIKKGHIFMSIVVNLETGQILHAVEGRQKEDIAPFFKKLAQKADNLQAIAMDMSRSYFAAALEYLPHVDVVFDRFHVSALLNRALDKLYCQQIQQQEKQGQKVAGATRFVLFRNYNELDPLRQSRLSALLEANHPLFIMHTMKEQLRLFWQLPTINSARRFLKLWCKDARKSGIRQLKQVAKTLAAKKSQLLNYFKYKLTSGKVEGIINKIKTLKRQTYGFRDMLYFKLRLHHLHVQRYSLSG